MTTPRAKPRQETPAVQAPVSPEPYGPVVLRLPPGWKLTEDQFVELCGLNDELRIEINARGELELMVQPAQLPVTATMAFQPNCTFGQRLMVRD